MNEQDYNQPVAYDAQGRPLYAHPPTTPTVPNAAPILTEPTLHHEPAHASPHSASIHGDAERHEQSHKMYPFLNLSEGEYVIEEIRRHQIGLLPMVGVAGMVTVLGAILLFLYPAIEKNAIPGSVPEFTTVLMPLVLIMALSVLLAYTAASIYMSNRFFLTNESVIEQTQTALFARKERTVGLHSIEEVTFSQSNLFQNMFGYGTVDITIEGHTIYHFPFVGNPKEKVDLLINTVEKVKASHH